jgi:hypothetical protein
MSKPSKETINLRNAIITLCWNEGLSSNANLDALLQSALDQAKAEEREACAFLVKQYQWDCNPSEDFCPGCAIAQEILAAIRARGEKP